MPESLGNLTQLTELDLSFNRLSGAIPEALGNLTQLTYLALRENELSGAMPEALGNFTQLTHLALSRNRLGGAIPEALGNFTQLTHLALSRNRLGGAVPESLGNLTQLILLGLSRNRLSGAIPGAPKWSCHSQSRRPRRTPVARPTAARARQRRASGGAAVPSRSSSRVDLRRRRTAMRGRVSQRELSERAPRRHVRWSTMFTPRVNSRQVCKCSWKMPINICASAVSSSTWK